MAITFCLEQLEAEARAEASILSTEKGQGVMLSHPSQQKWTDNLFLRWFWLLASDTSRLDHCVTYKALYIWTKKLLFK